MPGLYGYTKKNTLNSDGLTAMTDAMMLYSHFIQDPVLENEELIGSRVHLGVIGDKTSPITEGNCSIWLEGEAYNTGVVAEQLGLKAEHFSQYLLKAYQLNQLDCFLNKIDGYFIAVIFDKIKNKLLFISDRNGLKPLYIYENNGHVAWASHVRGILSLSHIKKDFNNESLSCFLDVGYLLGEATWFKHINLIKPASIVEYNISSQELSHRYYWQWSEIKPLEIDLDEAVEHLGTLLLNAVDKRFSPSENIGIPLSGGLDSRCLFAGVKKLHPTYKGFAFTFGKTDCEDVKIAKEVIGKSAWSYQTFRLTKDNWFKPRFKKVQDTDGLKDILHMHGSEFLPQIKEGMSISLNGYLGDAVLGGSYLNLSNLRDTKINLDIAKKLYGNYIQNIDFEFYDINHIDPFIYMNRARRLINAGSINTSSFIEQRKPFFDNDIMEFVFSLPDKYRENNLLYSKALINTFPEYFKSIPWQQTGKTIDQPYRPPSFIYKAINKIKRELLSLLGVESTKNFTDYPSWVREGDVAMELTKLLQYEGSLYSKYTDIDFYNEYLKPHLTNKFVDNSKMILRACTFEVYLLSLKDDGVEPFIAVEEA